MSRRIIFAVSLCLIVLAVTMGFWTVPQQETTWSNVIRLSSQTKAASEASLIADQYGFVHVFWAEENADETTLLLYARYDGETWSYPVDIYLSGANSPINGIAPFVDKQGILHVMWSEGLFPKFMRYTYAPANNALSGSKWAKPNQIRIQADQLDFLVDDEGVFHALIGMNTTNGRGVFYTQSRDRAVTWSIPLWLDPDNPADLLPSKITFLFDDQGGMHATWFYKAFEESKGDWVRYIRSLDQGKTWSEPFTIAKNSEGDDELNAFASPVMAVSGQTIHVIWAGGDLLYRHHRYSPDAGNTWSNTVRILGELNGQAGDGLGIDGAGRPHYFAQIRFPVGIYHSYLDAQKWTFPQMIYFIRFGNTDKSDSRIEAHATYPAIRLGNQVILTFTDPPPDDNRGLYVMMTTLKDVPPLSPEPTPLPAVTATEQGTSVEPQLTTTPVLSLTPTPTIAQGDTTPEQVGSPNLALVWGMAVSLTLIVVVLLYRQFAQN